MRSKRISAFIAAAALLLLSSLAFAFRVSSADGITLKDGSVLRIVTKNGEKYVYGVPERLKPSLFTYNFDGTVTVKDASDRVLTDSGVIKTGDRIINASSSEIALIIVTGDVSGDGKITVTDYLKLKRHFLKTYSLSDAFLLAADVNGDNKVDTSDYIGVKAHLIKTFRINSSFTNDNIIDTTETTKNYELPFVPIT